MFQDASKTTDAYDAASSTLPSLAASLPSMDKPNTPVPTLVLKLNRPVRRPRNVDAWNRLQRIEDIHVQSANTSPKAEPQYAISVFLRLRQSHIPTASNRATETSPLLGSSSPSAASSEKPDVVVLRSFAELETLRTQVWESIRQYHPVYCQLCDGLNLLMLTKLALFPMTIHRSRASRAKKMRTFLLRVLAELYQNKSMCVPACQGQHDLPLLLHSFLFGDEGTENADQAQSGRA